MARLQKKKTISKKNNTKKSVDQISQMESAITEKEGDVSASLPKSPLKKKEDGQKKTPLYSRSVAKVKSDSFINKSLQFLKEVKVELKKVSWPSRKQTIASTAVVIVLVMALSLFLGMVDAGLSGLVRIVLN
jgi:preprotein translocase subunit SecE